MSVRAGPAASQLLGAVVPVLDHLGPTSTGLLRRAERDVSMGARRLARRFRRGVDVTSVSLVSTAGYRLAGKVWRPSALSGRLPGLVLVADGDAGIAEAENVLSPVTAEELAAQGRVVLAVDLAGRGQSTGEDDHGGPEHHDDVLCAVQALVARDDVDPARVVLLGLGRGAPIAIGAAARGAPVRAVVDWEGPVDRETLLSGWPDAPLGEDDVTWWSDRDTLAHLAAMRCGWVRLQSEDDHANPQELRHAIRALAVAQQCKQPGFWFQINDHPQNIVPERPLWLFPGQHAARQAILQKLAVLLR